MRDGVTMTAVKKMRADDAALRNLRVLIGGKWVESASGEVLEVEDPAHRRPMPSPSKPRNCSA
jgi:hypothetical protein